MIINQSGPLKGTGVLFVVNRERDSIVTVRVLNDGNGSTITYEQSDTVGGSYETLSTSTSKGVFTISPTKDVIRARVSAYVSGTVHVEASEGVVEKPIGIVNLFQDGTTTRKGVVSNRYEHPGPHPTESISSVHIETRPVGAGKNLPSFADFSLTLSNIKKNWTLPSAIPGEIDGVYSVVRQGGPDADVGVEKSDAACFLGDITSRGPVGFATILEGACANSDRTTGTVLNNIGVQLGAIFSVPEARGTPEQYGLVLSSRTGVNSHGLFIQEQGGTWVNFIRCMRQGGTTAFGVTTGRITLGTGEIVAASLPAYISDAAAEAASVPVGGLYKAGGAIRIREASSALPVHRQRFVLASSYVNAALTGTTAETTLATIKIPAGLMGLNGRIEIKAMFQTTIVSASSNTKTARIRLGGLAGSVLGAIAATTNTNLRIETDLMNRNSATSQWNQTQGTGAAGLGMSILNVTGISVDTALDQDIVISGQLQNATDTITLNGYIVEFIPG
jgi:hypothetical protein